MKKWITEQTKGVIFDLDGTLIDSMGIWKDIDIEFLKRFGHELPEDLQDRIEGMSFLETARYFKQQFQIPLSLTEIMECWNQMAMEQYTHKILMKPGAKEFLAELEKMGISMAIASSNSHTLIDATLEAHGISGYFQTIVSGCDVKAGKPAPDVYLKAAESLGLDPEQCVVFEDIPAGIKAGKAAGMKVYAIEDEYSRLQREEKMQLSDGYFVDYRELIA